MHIIDWSQQIWTTSPKHVWYKNSTQQKTAGKFNTKIRRKIQRKAENEQIYIKHTQIAFCSMLKQQKYHKISKTAIHKKQVQKTNNFQLKQAQKQATHKSSKKKT